MKEPVKELTSDELAAVTTLLRGDWARRDLSILAGVLREKGFTSWAEYIEEAVSRLHAERAALEPRALRKSFAHELTKPNWSKK